MSRLTIVMYHYVRPLARTRFPLIKGLDAAAFDEQLAYVQRHYTVIDIPRLIAALDEREPLPPRALLLSFDDGLMDHYTYAFPRLAARGMSAVFFPPASVAIDRTLLDVNRVHYVLASGADIGAIVSYIDTRCANVAVEWKLQPIAAYRQQYWIANRFDPAPVIYVKRMLQHALPAPLRAILATELFRRYVSVDEAGFAEELYMSVDHLRVMTNEGMAIGSHGNGHHWLGHIDRDGQQKDILSSLRLLEALGVGRDHYSMCYPYGDYNADTIDLLKALGFKAAFTTECDLANATNAHRYTLARLDTNDLPTKADAAPNAWTQRATV